MTFGMKPLKRINWSDLFTEKTQKTTAQHTIGILNWSYQFNDCSRRSRHYRGVLSEEYAMASEVFFYGTCLIDLSFPEAGMAAIKLLRHFDFNVSYPQQQTCCGQPPFNSGYQESARDVLRPQLLAFEGDAPIVVPSASCAGMLKSNVPALFAKTEDAKRAEDFAGRIHELSAFLELHAISLQDQGESIAIAVHLSCASQRSDHSSKSMLNLLNSLEKVEIRQPKRAYECCGFGGTFAIKQPEISAAMALDKADSLLELEADRFICNDSGCLMNLTGTQAFQNRDLPAQHLYEFLWERIQ